MTSNPAVLAAQAAEVERKRQTRAKYHREHAKMYKTVHTTACGHGKVEVLEPGMADPYRISVDEYDRYKRAGEFLPGTVVTINGQPVMF